MAVLAAACVRAENDVAGAPTGGMDQSAALLCREGHALLLDCRSGATEQVPFDLPAAVAALLSVGAGVLTWMLVRHRANLVVTDWLPRRYYTEPLPERGAYLFCISRKI